MRSCLAVCALIACVYMAGVVCGQEPGSVDPKKVREEWVESNPVHPLSNTVVRTDAIVDLGRQLFFDTRLSASGDRSCNSCHVLDDYGANGGVEGVTPVRDVPSLYDLNSMLYYSWDARNRTLWDQTRESLTSTHEMGERELEAIVKQIASVKAYVETFKVAFPDKGVSADTVTHALVAFQEGLITESSWDRFLAGDDDAISVEALRGAELFDEHSCSSCHTGRALGGQMIQKLGVARPWPNQEDKGYSVVSGKSAHDMFFRVAPLRNIEKTKPYFMTNPRGPCAGPCITWRGMSVAMSLAIRNSWALRHS